jgi:dTDP-glucose pyrophosphorylase
MLCKHLLLKPDDTILTALEVIDKGGERFALVVDAGVRLLGVITDGNIRRAFLHGRSTTDSVTVAMNHSPMTVTTALSKQEAWAIVRRHELTHLPVLDAQGVLVDLLCRQKLQTALQLHNPVVFMVGGLGSRLGELTKNCPKPMLNIGGRPILEFLFLHFIEYGFNDFYFAVNYHAAMIENTFEDGSRYGVSITYLREDKPLGTAGALSLLPLLPELPVIVMNGDILTRINLRLLLEQHNEHKPALTMVVRSHSVQIPYGVIECKDGRVVEIQEKPALSFPISAGINVFSPSALRYIPHNAYCDVPDVVSRLLAENQRVDIFEFTDYWLDIGRLADYEKANEEFSLYFGDSS